METKDQLIKTIKEWVKMDNDIRKLQKEHVQLIDDINNLN
jgi:hypothetical protein